MPATARQSRVPPRPLTSSRGAQRRGDPGQDVWRVRAWIAAPLRGSQWRFRASDARHCLPVQGTAAPRPRHREARSAVAIQACGIGLPHP